MIGTCQVGYCEFGGTQKTVTFALYRVSFISFQVFYLTF